MSRRKLFDDFTKAHLAAWLEHTVVPRERAKVGAGIRRVVRDCPSLLDTHSWPEIRRLAEVEAR